MRNLTVSANKCMKMLDEINIPYKKPNKWRVSKRMTRAFGQYSISKHEIAITERLLDERLPIEMLENTIIHELIHTCDGCYNHGSKFQAYGRKVNRELGYNISTYVAKDEVKAMQEIYKPKDRPYIVYCPSCKTEFTYAIKSKVWKHPEMYVCTACRQRLKRKVS